MAYRIRYGKVMYDRMGKISLRFQIAVALVLLVCAWVLRMVWQDGAEMAAGYLASGPVTVTEQAVAAFGNALESGCGWYQGLVVWCRTVIDGAH